MKTVVFFLIVVCLLGCGKPDPAPNDTRLVIYPNPASVQATILVPDQPKPFSIKAYNSRGKLVANVSSTGGQLQIELKLDEEGTYSAVLSIGGDEIKETILRL